MAGNENTIELTFKMNDQGSITVDKINAGLKGIGENTEKMNSSLSIIKLDSLINLGERGYSLIKTFNDMAEAGAKVKSIEDSFAIMSRNSGVSIDALISKFSEATNRTVEMSDMMKAATRMISEGFSLDQITGIGGAARASARLMGTDVTEAYDKLTESIVGLREKGLKAAGFVIDLDAAYRKHAETLGVTKDELSLYGKQMALANEVVEKGRELQERLGVAIETTSEKMQQGKATRKEFIDDLSKAAAEAWDLANALIKKGASSGTGGGMDWAGEEMRTTGYDRMGVLKFYAQEEHDQAARAAALIQTTKAQIDETAILARRKADLKMFDEVNLQLLKDQASTIERMIALEEQQNKGRKEALEIADKLGMGGTKAGLTEWIGKDIIGEYEKLLGSKLFTPEELATMRDLYTKALQYAQTEGGWGQARETFNQIENAIGKINSMRVGETGLARIDKEMDDLTKYLGYLQSFTGKVNLGDDDIVRACVEIDKLKLKLDELEQKGYRITFEIVGRGSAELPIMDKIEEISRAFETMGSDVGNMMLRLNLSQMAQEAQRYRNLANAYRNDRTSMDIGFMVSGWSRYWEDVTAPLYDKKAQAIEEQMRMLQSANYMGGGAGGGGGGGPSINIGVINIIGGSDMDIAQKLDAAIAELWIKDRSKLKKVIEA